MPSAPTYPGVYIEELPSGVHTITGVATSITAFIGRALRGPTDRPVLVQSFAEFDRTYGGLWARSPLSYAVQHFFLNGGRDALIARVHNGAVAARVDLGAAAGFDLVAASEGGWGNRLRVRVDHDTRPLEGGETPDSLFNVSVRDGDGTVERYVNLSFEAQHPRFVANVLNLESRLVRVDGIPAARPAANGAPPPNTDPLTDNASSTPFSLGDDGGTIGAGQITDPALQAQKRGLWLLEQADLFNLLCIPPYTAEADIEKAVWDTAVGYCTARRAMLLVDPPSGWTTAEAARTQIDNLVTRSTNGAVFFPRIRVANPLRENRLDTFAPSGAVAGVFARTDGERGVWKAPAGIEATLLGVDDLSVGLTDNENGQLNPLAINCLRAFPVIGRVVWGSRTLRGADRLGSEWKYIPVRRMALYIEESLYRGTQWVVFEPNDEPLWSQIRLNVGAFMHDLFRQGAFQGRTPREAYFVKCSSETTTQSDIDHGIVNIIVGFAPLQPAEFVMIKIQQIREQVEA
jgi:phage tail sheath protein FI